MSLIPRVPAVSQHPLGQVRRGRRLLVESRAYGPPVGESRRAQHPAQSPARRLGPPIPEPRAGHGLPRRFVHQDRSRKQGNLRQPLGRLGAEDFPLAPLPTSAWPPAAASPPASDPDTGGGGRVHSRTAAGLPRLGAGFRLRPQHGDAPGDGSLTATACGSADRRLPRTQRWGPPASRRFPPGPTRSRRASSDPAPPTSGSGPGAWQGSFCPSTCAPGDARSPHFPVGVPSPSRRGASRAGR